MNYTGKTYTYRGVPIRKDDFGKFELRGKAWGDQAGENHYTFSSLKRAKEFLDRVAGEWGIK